MRPNAYIMPNTTFAPDGAARSGNTRITRSFRKNGRDWEYHATKGWRSYRVPGVNAGEAKKKAAPDGTAFNPNT